MSVQSITHEVRLQNWSRIVNQNLLPLAKARVPGNLPGACHDA